MNVQARRKGVVTILDIRGKLTLPDGDRKLRDAFRDAFAGGARVFVFNMEKVPFLDSMGIGELVRCHKRVREHDGVIRLVVQPQSKTHDVLQLTWLDRVFDIHVDEEEAIASFIGQTVG